MSRCVRRGRDATGAQLSEERVKNNSRTQRNLRHLLLKRNHALCQRLMINALGLVPSVVNALETSTNNLSVDFDSFGILVVVLGRKTETILFDPGDESLGIDGDVAFDEEGEEGGNTWGQTPEQVSDVKRRYCWTRRRTARVQEHERGGKTIALGLGIPLLQRLDFSTKRDLTLFIDGSNRSTRGGRFSPPSSYDLLDDFEKRFKSLSVDRIFVEAGRPEGTEVVDVVLIGRGEMLRRRLGEDFEDDALRSETKREREDALARWRGDDGAEGKQNVPCCVRRYPELIRTCWLHRGWGASRAILRLRNVPAVSIGLHGPRRHLRSSGGGRTRTRMTRTVSWAYW